MVDYLESQYKRIILADDALISYVNQQQLENGIYHSDISTYHLNTIDKAALHKAVAEGTDVFKRYAKSFKRDVAEELKPLVELDEDFFDSFYKDLPREECLSLVTKAARARDWDAWKTHFRNVVKNMDRQYLEIRAARKELFKYDPVGTDRGRHVDFPGWDAEINWSELIL